MNKVSKALTPAFLIAAVAIPAHAQDSVSNIPAPQPQAASDALSPYNAADNCNQFVIDLVPFTSTWGTAYAGAPLLKSSKLEANFGNSFFAGNAISRVYADVQLAGDYLYWNQPGYGIHTTNNNTPGTIAVNALTKQFAVVASDYAGDINSIAAGVVNFDPANPGRLYVSRHAVAVNGLNESGNTAQLGVGTVDEHGVVAFRADNFGTSGSAILGNNLFTVASLNRNCSVINQIWNDPSQGGTANGTDAGATTVHIENHGNTVTVPNTFPAKYNGTSTPITTGFDFDYYNGSFSAFANSSTRGALSFASTPVLGNANGVASAGILTQTGSGTRAFQIADLDANANVVGSWQVYDANNAAVQAQWGGFQSQLTSTWEFSHYRGPTAYRGGVSQLALGTDKDGNGLAAAFVSALGAPDGAYQQDPIGAIVAMRDADGIANGNEQWTLVAQNSLPSGRGTPILNGPGGTAAGYLSNSLDYPVFPQIGPSLSAPAFDAMGNIWFTAPVEFVDDPNQPFDATNIDMAVIRGVYNPATFTYELEAVLRTGTIFAGANSGTNYIINIIGLPANTAIASSAFFSSAVMDTTYADVDRSTLDPASNLSTGGVAVALTVIYDTDGDDFYDFNANLEGINDETYQVLYFIAPDAEPIIVGPTCPCPADLNGDCVVDADDLGLLLGSFGCAGSACGSDINGDGIVDADDLGLLLGSFGCAG